MNINLFEQGNKTVAFFICKESRFYELFLHLPILCAYFFVLCVIEFIGAEHCESAIKDNDARVLFTRFQSVTRKITFNVNNVNK
jgi:hypothetical protein